MSRLVLLSLLAGGCGTLVYEPPKWMDRDPAPAAARRLGGPHDELHLAYRMARILGYQEITAPEIVNLKGGREARMVLLQRTQWTMRAPSQAMFENMKRRAAYMRLPEKERLRHMTRSDDFIQLWWLPAGKRSWAELSLASSLPPTDRPHQAHREVVLLGHDEKSAYYVFAPIPEWIRVQQVERLQGGEDPRRAALRGLGVKDPESYTAFLCSDLLASWGKDALPLVEEAVAKGRPERGSAVLALGQVGEAAVTTALIRWTSSGDAEVASAARRALVERPRAEAKALYAAWLAADAGRKPVEPLLRALVASSGDVEAPVLARVLASPESVAEFRLAFTLLRKKSGRPLPKMLLDAEGVVRRAGTPEALAAGGQARVDGGVMVMLTVGDAEATAVVGLALAMTVTKGGDPAVSRAGVTVLKSLPPKAMETVVRHLARALRGPDRAQVQRVVEAVQGKDGI